MEDNVADAMNRGFFLAPNLIGEGDFDPLLAQAIQNVKDEAEEVEVAAEARKAALARAADARKATAPNPPHPESSAEFRSMVNELVGALGMRYVALIGGATRTGLLADWMGGYSVPAGEHIAKLRLAFELVEILHPRVGDKDAEHWFLTKNPALDNQMPLALIVLRPAASVQERLRAAAAV
ncbi:MAG: hypothetical protein ACREML_00370 [Vulcanimicrobiaceae bacterium]